MGKKKNSTLRGDNAGKAYGFPDDIKKLEKELCVARDTYRPKETRYARENRRTR